ncbi:MAG: hypothetical protein ACOCPC_10270 [Segatella copri]
MKRQAKSSIHKFEGLEDSPAIKGIEKIYEANEEARQKRAAEALEKQKNGQGDAESEQQTQDASISAPSVAPDQSVAPAVITAPASEPTSRKAGKKTQNGITIYVPMEYYMQILQMKMETGTPIKDIALQAVIEYLDRHKND